MREWLNEKLFLGLDLEFTSGQKNIAVKHGVEILRICPFSILLPATYLLPQKHNIIHIPISAGSSHNAIIGTGKNSHQVNFALREYSLNANLFK